MTTQASSAITLSSDGSVPCASNPRLRTASGHARCRRTGCAPASASKRTVSGHARRLHCRGSGFIRRRWLRAALCAVAALHWAPAVHAVPEVVVSIKPVHALVSGVMGELGMPRLIVDGAATPHTYQMRPSEAAALRSADLIVWVGETLEVFLARPIASLGADAQVVTLQRATGMRLLRNREGGLWKARPMRVGDVENARDRGELDAHIWLDPGNAQRIVEAVAAALAHIHREEAAAYRRNAAFMRSRIAALEADLRHRLAPVRSHAFVVFHDGYQYFEHAFGLNGIGAVTLGPTRLPGARRLATLRNALAERDVRCLFTEPQFEARLARTVVERTAVRTAVLDPLGADISAGAEAWFTLLRRMGDTIAECLGGA